LWCELQSLPERTYVASLSAQLRRPFPRPAMAALRRLRPPLGNGRLPDFHCKSVTIAPLAPYAPKAKTASECGEVPHIGTKQLLYPNVISVSEFLPERENWSHTTSHISHN